MELFCSNDEAIYDLPQAETSEKAVEVPRRARTTSRRRSSASKDALRKQVLSESEALVRKLLAEADRDRDVESGGASGACEEVLASGDGGDDVSALDEHEETLVEHTMVSFHSRVQAMVLYDDGWRFEVLVCWVLSVLCILCQIAALSTVWEMIYVTWSLAVLPQPDDDPDQQEQILGEGGLPWPMNFVRYNRFGRITDNKVHGVVLMNAGPILFFSYILTLQTQTYWNRYKAGEILGTSDSWRRGRTRLDVAARRSAAYVISSLRFALHLNFFDVTCRRCECFVCRGGQELERSFVRPPRRSQRRSSGLRAGLWISCSTRSR